jgi:hypothetical protein
MRCGGRVMLVGAALAAILVMAGCGSPAGPGKQEGDSAGKKPKEDDHSHGTGPHGGAVCDWGKYHLEFTVDHQKKEATVYVLKLDAKAAAPIKADQLLLKIKDPPFELVLKPAPQEKDPKGTASRFVGKHDRLGKEQEFEGTITGEVGGKTYTGEFKEEPEKK